MITVFDMSTGEVLSAAATTDQEFTPTPPPWPAAALQLLPVAAEPRPAAPYALPPDLATVSVARWLRRHGG